MISSTVQVRRRSGLRIASEKPPSELSERTLLLLVLSPSAASGHIRPGDRAPGSLIKGGSSALGCVHALPLQSLVPTEGSSSLFDTASMRERLGLAEGLLIPNDAIDSSWLFSLLASLTAHGSGCAASLERASPSKSISPVRRRRGSLRLEIDRGEAPEAHGETPGEEMLILSTREEPPANTSAGASEQVRLGLGGLRGRALAHASVALLSAGPPPSMSRSISISRVAVSRRPTNKLQQVI